jgi:hypothetical protein
MTAEAIMSSEITRACALLRTAEDQAHLWLEAQPDGKLRWMNADGEPAMGLGEYATVGEAVTALIGLNEPDDPMPCRLEIWHYPARSPQQPNLIDLRTGAQWAVEDADTASE